MGKPTLQYEAGQTVYPAEAMTTDDNLTFQASFTPWSDVAGSEPVIMPYGLLTGGAITATETNDQISVAALTAMMPGATGASATTGVLSVSSGTLSVSRGLTTDTHRITSITINSSGELAAVAGVDNTAFSETRGADGGPPFIPVGSIEIGQVRLTSITAAVVATAEIFTTPNVHVETSAYPVYQSDFGRGQITFAAALPEIHTGGVPKLVYVRGATPLFAPLSNVADFVPAETTYSISSEDSYDGPIGSESGSLGQATFTALGLKDGITDALAQQKGKKLWFKFLPDRDKSTPYMLTQGILGISRTYPASGGSFSASCTITPGKESLGVAA